MKTILLQIKRGNYTYKLSGWDFTASGAERASRIMKNNNRSVILVEYPKGSAYKGSNYTKYTDAPIWAIYYR